MGNDYVSDLMHIQSLDSQVWDFSSGDNSLFCGNNMIVAIFYLLAHFSLDMAGTVYDAFNVSQKECMCPDLSESKSEISKSF